MKQERIYVRPDPDTTREEGINQVVDAFMTFLAEQLEREGKHEQTQLFRERIAREKNSGKGGT
jgi:hypothetical protein